jgi:hypothetical protein
MPISFCGNCAWVTDEDTIKDTKKEEKKRDIEEKRKATSSMTKNLLGKRPQNKMGRPPEVKEVVLSEENPDSIEGEEVSVVKYADKAKVFRHVLWMPKLVNDAISKEAEKQNRLSSAVIKDILRLHFGLRVSKHHPQYKGGAYNDEGCEDAI